MRSLSGDELKALKMLLRDWNIDRPEYYGYYRVEDVGGVRKWKQIGDKLKVGILESRGSDKSGRVYIEAREDLILADMKYTVEWVGDSVLRIRRLQEFIWGGSDSLELEYFYSK